jgi:hypothetical protein
MSKKKRGNVYRKIKMHVVRISIIRVMPLMILNENRANKPNCFEKIAKPKPRKEREGRMDISGLSTSSELLQIMMGPSPVQPPLFSRQQPPSRTLTAFTRQERKPPSRSEPPPP